MARYDGYELDENGDIIIDVTKMRAPRIEAADRSLTQRGAGGLRIVDPIMPEDGFGIRREAAGVSGDGRIVLSPEAIGELGKRQIMEERAALALQGPLPKQNLIDVTRRDMQRVADMGFVPRGTDPMRQAQMRGTLKRGQQDWLERNRPRDMMQRLNTSDQIMAQAEASQMTPQVMTQDGIMAGWDPIQKKIVSDSSAAESLAQSRLREAQIQADGGDRQAQIKADAEERVAMLQADRAERLAQIQTRGGVKQARIQAKSGERQAQIQAQGGVLQAQARAHDRSLDAEDDKTLIDTYSKMQQRKAGKLGETEARWYSMLLKQDPKEAEQYKRTIIGEWTDNDEQLFGQITSRLSERGLLNKAPAGKANKWALK